MAERSLIKEECLHIIQDLKQRILNDECNEDELLHFIERTNAHSKGYFKRGDFVNYDEAMRILEIGDRNTLKAFLDKHNVTMQRINNQRVGFLRSEVEALTTEAKKTLKRTKRTSCFHS